MKRGKNFDKNLILLSLIVLTVLVTALVLFLQVRTDKITDAVQQKQPISVLFVVTDGEKPIFSNVFLYHPATSEGAILDVPGNLGLIIESLNRFDRIDVLYKRGNIRAFKDRIERVTGLSIPFYVEMSLDNVERIVDLLEGLELFMANPVERLDPGHLVLLPSGSVTMDGRKVRDYLLYEETEESRSEVINRRQRLLQSLLKSLGQKSAYLGHNKVFPYLKENLATNLDSRALESFVKELVLLSADRIIFHFVVGTERAVDEQNLLFPPYDGALFRGRIRQIMETLGSTEAAERSQVSVTLQILNGTAAVGIAGRTSRLFQSFGYEDSLIGNADRTTYEQTVVIDRRGNVADAQKVADIIRCTRVESVPDEAIDGRIDITIIIGKDFDGRYCR